MIENKTLKSECSAVTNIQKYTITSMEKNGAEDATTEYEECEEGRQQLSDRQVF